MNNERLGKKTSPCNWPEKSQNHDEARWEGWACFWERILRTMNERLKLGACLRLLHVSYQSDGEYWLMHHA
jgi:hypothetical protein